MVKKNFPTGSSYEGSWDQRGVPEMAGYGTYRYPDGTLYRGFFKDGLFHGVGTIILVANEFLLEGNFVNGSCVEIIDMKFGDGLLYKAQDWKYCDGKDRRFWSEVKYGLDAVGESFEAGNKQLPTIPPGCYDTTEGIFDPESGFLMTATNQDMYKRTRFVHPDERKWIIENCRPSRSDQAKRLITSAQLTDIIENNLTAADFKNDPPCVYFTSTEVKNKCPAISDNAPKSVVQAKSCKCCEDS